MDTIKTIEDFWEAVDSFRQERELNWQDLVGPNAKLAAEKKLNPSLTVVLGIQEKLGISFFTTLPIDISDIDEDIKKDPWVPTKMAQIYDLIQSDQWMEDEEVVKKVQELAETIM
ncbi:hypothetical protein [Candidatus Enterococcus clewellii]|uniref:Uncharacterized protein n=1 Tax=Candidatus Enterococcus clewellii TaxID=1834193 RepID=A0A242K398_9ENTE|nr:hypothetical protein [Enterococcus sp. 9E7_DIV0242]OTP12685.1 hypothetical protein A5888_003263 [Enterococcus sp. 9E7_DIV0242]